MNKDYEFKHSAGYESHGLKSRVSDMLKGVRDQVDEVKNSRAKTLPIIPVTGGTSLKYLNNKSAREY